MVSSHLHTSVLNADVLCKPGHPVSAQDLSHVIASFSHQIENVLFDARNLHEKNLAAKSL